MIKRFIYTIFSVCLVFAFTGCGGSTGSDAPELATITFTPASLTIDIAAPLKWEVASFTIIVKNADGIPLSNVKLNISFPFAKSATLTDGYFVELLGDNGITESPMEAKTGTNGTYVLNFRFKRGGISYVADILATSGTSSKIATFTVSDGS